MSTTGINQDIFVNEIRRIRGWEGEYGDYGKTLYNAVPKVVPSGVAKSKAPGRVRKPEEVMMALNASVCRAADAAEKLVAKRITSDIIGNVSVVNNMLPDIQYITVLSDDTFCSLDEEVFPIEKVDAVYYEIDQTTHLYEPKFDDKDLVKTAEKIVRDIVAATNGVTLLDEQTRDDYRYDYFIPVNNIIGPVAIEPGLLSAHLSSGVHCYYEQVLELLDRINKRPVAYLIVLGGAGYKTGVPSDNIQSRVLYCGDYPDPLFTATIARNPEYGQDFDAIRWNQWKNSILSGGGWRGYASFDTLYGPLPLSAQDYKDFYMKGYHRSVSALMTMDQYKVIKNDPYVVTSEIRNKKGRRIKGQGRVEICTSFCLLDPATEVGVVFSTSYSKLYIKSDNMTNKGRLISQRGVVSSYDTPLFGQGRKVLVQYVRLRLEESLLLYKHPEYMADLRIPRIDPSSLGWKGEEGKWHDMWASLTQAFGANDVKLFGQAQFPSGIT